MVGDVDMACLTLARSCLGSKEIVLSKSIGQGDGRPLVPPSLTGVSVEMKDYPPGADLFLSTKNVFG